MSNGTLSSPNTPKDLHKITPERVVIAGTMVSIVIPCCGMKQYTVMCIQSILKHTRMPYELIFLDIGSLDGTDDVLLGLSLGLQQVRIEVVRTPTDLGISQACRQALDKCLGEYIVLLNNDTIVTKGWINQMISLLSNPKFACGMVGPLSNYAAPPQLIETVPYRSGLRKPKQADGTSGLIDVDAVQAFAAKIREENQGKWLHTERLGGFCLMMTREVYRKLDQQGDLNKASDLSLFDTDFLSTRVRKLGYNLGVCRDLFIHHFGTRTSTHGAPDANERTVVSAR